MALYKIDTCGKRYEHVQRFWIASVASQLKKWSSILKKVPRQYDHGSSSIEYICNICRHGQQSNVSRKADHRLARLCMKMEDTCFNAGNKFVMTLKL